MNAILFILMITANVASLNAPINIAIDEGGIFCPCKLDCEKGWTEVCKCGTFTCICNCVKDNISSGIEWSDITPGQIENLQKLEQHLRRGSIEERILADDIREIQNAIFTRDIQQYSEAGSKADRQYLLLSQERRSQIEHWINNNLK